MIQIKTQPQLSPHFDLADIEKSFLQFMNRTDVGFTKLPFDNDALKKSITLGQDLLKNFEHLVLIGIGGSSMGPRALAEISGSSRISFLDNVDAVETARVIKKLKDLKKTAWLMISKTGSTIEVLWTLELVEQIYSEAKVDFWPNTFYITENTDNPLQRLAKKYSRPSLEVPLDVGGRFSVLSPVGLVVAEYLKMSSEKIHSGARSALESKALILKAVQQYLNSFERKETITLFWFYSSNMRWFGCWLQQLWAESLGKNKTNDQKQAPAFSSPMISIGTCDQHSILQQIMEGPRDKFVNVFRFVDVETSSFKIKKSLFAETKVLEGHQFGDLIKAEAIATDLALQNSGISTMSVEVPGLDEASIGFLFMFFQLVVATLGEFTQINAFNQPGVALSKKLTLELLAQSKG